MKRRRILFVDTEHVWRGGQQQLFTLISGLQQRGHTVELAAPDDAPLFRRCGQLRLKTHPFSQRSEISPAGFIRLSRILHRNPVDILHLNTPRPMVTGALAAWVRGVPVRVISRRVIFPLKSQLSRYKYRFCVDEIVCVSSSIRESLIDQGLEPSRISVIHEGVDTESFDRLEAESSFREKSPTVLIAIVAHLSGEKGHADLLRAFSRLSERDSARLIIFGDGPLRSELESLTESLGLGATVVFAGFRKDVDALIKKMDIFCLPSHSEGLSSAILAAMAAHLPVIATDVGGSPELVVPGETGLLVPPGNPEALARALSQLIASPSMRSKFGDAGRSRLEKMFTVSAKLDASEALYDRLLAQSVIG